MAKNIRETFLRDDDPQRYGNVGKVFGTPKRDLVSDSSHLELRVDPLSDTGEIFSTRPLPWPFAGRFRLVNLAPSRDFLLVQEDVRFSLSLHNQETFLSRAAFHALVAFALSEDIFLTQNHFTPLQCVTKGRRSVRFVVPLQTSSAINSNRLGELLSAAQPPRLCADGSFFRV